MATKKIVLREVGPREGAQSEPRVIPTEVRIEHIRRLAESGVKEIEVGSFVHPKRVPQLADTARVIAALDLESDVKYTALVPNRRGMENALATRIRRVAVLIAASETFNKKNIGLSISESKTQISEIVELATAHQVEVIGYISSGFFDLTEERIDPLIVVDLARFMFDLGISLVSVGDTNGLATPIEVEELIRAFRKQSVKLSRISFHMHNTWGRALANVLHAINRGITHFDSAAGALGGCPVTKVPSGNVGTEDLLSLFDKMNLVTGVDLDKVVAASNYLTAETGILMNSRVLEAFNALHALQKMSDSSEEKSDSSEENSDSSEEKAVTHCTE